MHVHRYMHAIGYTQVPKHMQTYNMQTNTLLLIYSCPCFFSQISFFQKTYLSIGSFDQLFVFPLCNGLSYFVRLLRSTLLETFKMMFEYLFSFFVFRLGMIMCHVVHCYTIEYHINMQRNSPSKVDHMLCSVQL